jgi:hypothetical protein
MPAPELLHRLLTAPGPPGHESEPARVWRQAAEEFADEVNAQGVQFRLGDALFSEDADKEVYAVELDPLTELPGSGSGHTGGSLTVHEDSGEAEDAIESCQDSADLTCYRAANIVVVLEPGGIEAQQLGVAIEKLAE